MVSKMNQLHFRNLFLLNKNMFNTNLFFPGPHKAALPQAKPDIEQPQQASGCFFFVRDQQQEQEPDGAHRRRGRRKGGFAGGEQEEEEQGEEEEQERGRGRQGTKKQNI